MLEKISEEELGNFPNEEQAANNSSIAVMEKVEEKEKIVVKGGKVYAFFKRVFDIFSSFFMLLLCLLPMLIVSIIIKLTSKGPVLFKDKRVGKNGKKVTIYKFRSMYIDSETNIDKYLNEEQKEQWFRERKIDNDPRITKIGRFIRKTSIDELPQLINILFGQMSVVGPRPITLSELEENYTNEEIEILLSTRPGLTGYWQVYGRSNVSYEQGERQKLELEYFKHRGFWFDIGLIFKTIPAVLKHRGAK